MILYVNGDSHTAAAEAVNVHAFAEDDGNLWPAGREPHPDNLAVSWGKQLADSLGYDFVCEAESASSNDRIMRTTKHYLETNIAPDLVILQWSTWEREEWLINNTHYQVNASGIDDIPQSHKQQYKDYVVNINWPAKTQQAHIQIYNFHLYLKACNISHLFFNGNNTFGNIFNRYNWEGCYLKPYASSYNHILRDKFTKRNNGYHYGAEAHKYWANYILNYLLDNQLV